MCPEHLAVRGSPGRGLCKYPARRRKIGWLRRGRGAPGAQSGQVSGGRGAVHARPLDRPPCRSFSQAMPPLWVLLALGCLRLGSGKQRMRGGGCARGGRAAVSRRVSCTLILPKGPQRSLDGKWHQEWELIPSRNGHRCLLCARPCAGSGDPDINNNSQC